MPMGWKTKNRGKLSIGGDEFVVLMGDLSDADTALSLAEKIRLAVARPFTVNALELTISCSLGVAVFPDDGMDEETLTTSADKAMYRANGDGRNNVKQASEGSREIRLAAEVEDAKHA